jgi:hypothetical protein
MSVDQRRKKRKSASLLKLDAKTSSSVHAIVAGLRTRQ